MIDSGSSRKGTKGKYIEQLYLRSGEQVRQRSTGRFGKVDRAITNKRYMIDFGTAKEPVGYKDLERPAVERPR